MANKKAYYFGGNINYEEEWEDRLHVAEAAGHRLRPASETEQSDIIKNNIEGASVTDLLVCDEKDCEAYIYKPCSDGTFDRLGKEGAVLGIVWGAVFHCECGTDAEDIDSKRLNYVRRHTTIQ